MNLELNRRSLEILRPLSIDPERYRVKVIHVSSGATVIDTGITVKGGYEAGLLVAEASLGGLGTCTLRHWAYAGAILPSVFTVVSYPAIATLGCQFAAWYFDDVAPGTLIGGPARAVAQNPSELFEDICYKEEAESIVVIIEAKNFPPTQLYTRIASTCNLETENVFAVIAPTSSLSGSTQIASRAVEIAVLRLYRAGLRVNNIVAATGIAPIPPTHPDPLIANGRSNDSLLYCGTVTLSLRTNDDKELDKIKSLLPELTTKDSPDHTKPFYQILKEVDFDFRNLPDGFFRPARIAIQDLRSGELLTSGAPSPEIFLASIHDKKIG
ncbi:MAG: methenyltetrahydromethanopterin cyclohydrolase [Candidatus Ranarchaeia archaeon]